MYKNKIFVNLIKKNDLKTVKICSKLTSFNN